MKNTKKSLGLVAALFALVGLSTLFTGTPVTSADLGASPVGGRPDYEILVTLSSDGARENFEYRKTLTRSEYNDVRFSPKRAKEKAVKEAKKKLVKKQAYFQELYGEETEHIEQMQVVDVLLVDNRQGKEISLLRQAAI